MKTVNSVYTFYSSSESGQARMQRDIDALDKERLEMPLAR